MRTRPQMDPVKCPAACQVPVVVVDQSCYKPMSNVAGSSKAESHRNRAASFGDSVSLCSARRKDLPVEESCTLAIVGLSRLGSVVGRRHCLFIFRNDLFSNPHSTYPSIIQPDDVTTQSANLVHLVANE